MKFLPKQRLYRFKEKTISLALNYVKAYIATTGEQLIKEFFIKNPKSTEGVPQELHYKTFSEAFYGNAYSKVETKDDQQLFAYLCRVMIYRYAIHKGYVKNNDFTFSDYIANTGKKLYELGVLKLGREDTPKPKTNSQLMRECAETIGVPVVDLNLSTVANFEHTKQFIRTTQWEEPNMSQIQSLVNVAKTEATLIHGRLLSEVSEADLIRLIRQARKAQEDIKDLVDTSVRMKARYEQLEADIKVYAEALDALPVDGKPATL